ncbi:hypothetical protein [Microbacterium sp. NPDC079176]|uniref:hypothetical protein n=1 Tax=Microbacterium sp. NPDC079176 TaxID=3154768 RepID=UPI00344A0698
MADNFKRSVSFSVSTNDDVWNVTQHLFPYIHAALAQFDGFAVQDGVSVRDDEGSSVEREDLEAARAAAREHHIRPSDISARFSFRRGVRPPEGADERQLEWFRTETIVFSDVVVRLRSMFMGENFKSASLIVELEGSDKSMIDALHAKLSAESQTLEREGLAASPEAVPPHSVQTNVFSGNVNVGVLGNNHGSVGSVAVGDTTTSTPPSIGELQGSWLSRTWRDHTATFVVTVVAGIAVIAIATWMGLQGV